MTYHKEYNHISVLESIETEVLKNFPDNLREWKIFIYKCISDGMILYNDTELSIELFNDLKANKSIVFDGVYLHQGESSERYRWSAIKYPKKYYRNPTPDLRKLIFIRDNYLCTNCGADKDLSIDHIIPWSLGGKTEYHNLQTLCRRCNSSKGNR
jgi:hypothetical protein